MNKSDIHSFDKDLPTFSTEEPKNFIIYLIHEGTWNVLFRYSDMSLPAIIYAPFYVGLVYIASFYIYEFYALIELK